MSGTCAGLRESPFHHLSAMKKAILFRAPGRKLLWNAPYRFESVSRRELASVSRSGLTKDPARYFLRELRNRFKNKERLRAEPGKGVTEQDPLAAASCAPHRQHLSITANCLNPGLRGGLGLASASSLLAAVA